MLASALTFTLMTTLIKYLGADYPPGLQTFYRQAAGLVVMAPIILRNPAAAFHTTRPVVLGLRSLGGVTALVLAFYAYQHLPLAEANALSFTRTLWIVPLAAFVLREQVGPWRIGAAMVGFAGVLVMLHPSGGGSLSLPTLSALASAGLLAATVTGMKVMTRDHSVTALMAWAAVLGFALTIPLAILDWRWPAPFDLLLLCLMGDRKSTRLNSSHRL